MLTRKFLKSTYPPNHLETLNALSSDEEIGASSPRDLNTGGEYVGSPSSPSSPSTSTDEPSQEHPQASTKLLEPKPTTPSAIDLTTVEMVLEESGPHRPPASTKKTPSGTADQSRRAQWSAADNTSMSRRAHEKDENADEDARGIRAHENEEERALMRQGEGHRAQNPLSISESQRALKVDIMETVLTLINVQKEEASEDALSESRSHQRTLEAILHSVEHTAKVVENVSGRLETVTTEVAALATQVAALRKKPTPVATSVATGVTSALASVKDALAMTTAATGMTSVQAASRDAAPMTPPPNTLPRQPNQPWTPERLLASPGGGGEQIQLLGREPKQSEVARTLSTESLQSITPAVLLTTLQQLTAGTPELYKLKYAELAMSDDLRKEYETLPSATKRNIKTLNNLCKLFLINRVMMAKAPTIMTLNPVKSNKGDKGDLAENLQFLTNLGQAEGFETTSTTDLLETCLPKQHQFAGVNHMAASQNSDGLNTLTNEALISAFRKANLSYFITRPRSTSGTAHLAMEDEDADKKQKQATFVTRPAEARCGGACTPHGQWIF